MLRFDSLRIEECATPLSCTFDQGAFGAILTPREAVSEHVHRLLLGFEHPVAGTIVLMDNELPSATKETLKTLRQEIGSAYPGGGLISNLRVGENVSLPLSYHTAIDESEIHERVASALDLVGFRGKPGELPGNLSPAQRRQVGFARVIATRPRVVIYAGFFDGMHAEERQRLLALAKEFHGEDGKRLSLVITANQTVLLERAFDITAQFG